MTPEQHALVEQAVKSREYQSASEAVRDALRSLQQRRCEDALKLDALQRQTAVAQPRTDPRDNRSQRRIAATRHSGPQQ